MLRLPASCDNRMSGWPPVAKGESLTLQGYLQVLRKHWILIAVCTGLAIAAASAVILTTSPTYTASVQLFVSTRGTTDISGAYTGDLFTQSRVKSYTDIVGTPAVTAPVIARLRLPETPAQLAGKISASAPLNTVLIDISVHDRMPVIAANIANAVAAQFVNVVDELERPAASTVSTVKVSIVRPATVPLAPTSPRKKLDLALGLLVGLAIGAGGAVLRESLDQSVGSPEDVQAATDAPTIGAIAYDGDARGHPLIVHERAHSTRSESFRQLRTNLQFIDVDHAPKSIVITSSVPEEGKTTTACNLAIALGQAGQKVLLVEADLRRPRVGGYLGVEGAVGLTHLLIGKATLADVIQPWGDGLIDVLPSGATPPNPSELLGSRQMQDLVRRFEQQYDMVLFDTPPLLPVTDAAVLASFTSGAVVVVRYGKTRRDQLANAVNALRAVDVAVLGVVMNMTPTKGPAAYYYGYGADYTSKGADAAVPVAMPVAMPVAATSTTVGPVRVMPAAAASPANLPEGGAEVLPSPLPEPSDAATDERFDFFAKG